MVSGGRSQRAGAVLIECRCCLGCIGLWHKAEMRMTSGIVKRTDLAFFLLISLFSLLISICCALLSWMKSVN